MGNSVDTWTNGETKAYWPNLILKDEAFSGANIFVVDLPSPRFGRSLSIDELADNLRLTLESYNVLAHEEVIVIAHSMGGLITRAFLAKYRDVISRIKFIYFYATPTTGSSVASIAKLVSQNPQFAKMVPMTSEAYLADLQRTWLASPDLSFVPSFCAYELQLVAGLKIVEQQSATNLCNRRLDPLDYNHIDIVKPAGTDDVRYLAFKSAYTSTASRLQLAIRAEIENVTQIRQLLGDTPQAEGQQVYCDAIRFTLLLAHSKLNSSPVRINSIAVHVRDIQDTQLLAGACKVDVLSSKPYGIVETDTFLLTSSDSGLKAKFIQNAEKAFEVSSDNLLRSASSTRAVTLKSGEEPVGFDVLMQARAKRPQQIWFSIQYDHDGAKTLTTKPIFIWR
jgi:pimeloyl-ACP methyl ester carboxylesterase